MNYNKSILKWAGSKNKVLPVLLPILEKYKKPTFVEPFIGAANVSLNFNADNYIWADLNNDLIQTYKDIFDNSSKYIQECKSLFQLGHGVYNQVRDSFNKGGSPLMKSSLFQYLNKHGFNGLCRYNKKGEYNVPIGTISKTPKNVPVTQIEYLCDRHKNNTRIIHSDFESIFKRITTSEFLVYCFDKETELLTKDGWKFVKDITTQDSCLSRELTTNVIDWVEVSRTYSREYIGEMYKYKGKSVDVFVTKNHNLLLNNPHNNQNIKIRADQSLGKCLRWVCGGGVWEKGDLEMMEICGLTVPKHSFAYILGIFVTDGCVNNQGSITISQTKENVVVKIKNHLEACGIEYSEYSNNTIYITRKMLPFFKQFYLKNKRSIPREFLDSSKEVLSKLLEGVVDGDGDNAKGRSHIRISLASKPLVDNIMEIAVKLGKSSNFFIRPPKESYLKSEGRMIKGKNIYYVVSINTTINRSKRKINESLVEYSGSVFCVTLYKWNNVLMRRNGKMCWIGQCDPPYVPLTSDFDYTGSGFGKVEQESLKQLAKENKSTVILSNHWTDYTKELYSDADEIHTFPVQRTISCDGGGRKKVEECIVVYKGEGL